MNDAVNSIQLYLFIYRDVVFTLDLHREKIVGEARARARTERVRLLEPVMEMEHEKLQNFGPATGLKKK